MTNICRVLLIDDNPEDRADFRQMLLRGSDLRYDFTEAEMGSTGLQKVREKQATQKDCKPFDCILLDFHLPDMNALEVLTELCGTSDLPPCPVVVITGQGAENANGPKMLRAGAQDYIGKSWTTPESLTRAIENSIERYDLFTKRKIAETELRESEERYRNLFSSINEGLCVIEKIEVAAGEPVDFRYVDVNPAFTAQFGITGVLGKTFREVFPNEPEESLVTYDSVCTTGMPRRFERNYADHGRIRQLNTFRIGGPESRQVAIIFNDITERRQSELQALDQAKVLIDMDRRKDEFLAMLSHELRNPLAPISSALKLLSLQKNEDPLQQQAHAIIGRQVGQLNRLVDDLLEVSRITTGRVQLRQEKVALDSIVTRAVETAHPLILQRRHDLKVSLPPQTIWLHADAARLEQVVVNLLTNAAKYTDNGGRIALTVEQQGASAVLRVRDTGIGIDPDLLPFIFELFTQAERSLDRAQGGLGIGLSLVQQLVALHGGTVEANSVVGQGSEFIVRLPVTLPSVPLLPLPLIETARPGRKYCRVLAVDDNVDAAQAMKLMLEFSGHEVRIANDGLGALEAAIAWCPDVVLLDIGLPGFSGFEVAKRIRKEATLGNIVLVALTGYGHESDRQRSREAGFDHHLVKPADFEAIEEILDSIAKLHTGA